MQTIEPQPIDIGCDWEDPAPAADLLALPEIIKPRNSTEQGKKTHPLGKKTDK